MRIGVAQLGRAIHWDPEKWSHVGTAAEVTELLRTLAERRPDDTIEVVGRTAIHGGEPADAGLPSNVIDRWRRDVDLDRIVPVVTSNRTLDDVLEFHESQMAEVRRSGLFEGLDAFVFIIGMSCSVHSPVPKLRGGGPVSPLQVHLDSAYLLRMVNEWRDVDPLSREEVWIQPDGAYGVDMRDLKWPLRHPILSQYEFEAERKAYRYGDDTPPDDWENAKRWGSRDDVWVVKERYMPSGFETLGAKRFLDEGPTPGEGFGTAANRHTGQTADDRAEVVADWIAPIPGARLWGKWTDETQDLFDEEVQPLPYPDYVETVRGLRSTFCLPVHGWPTLRLYENWALGTVPFLHPRYDDQGWAVPGQRPARRGPVERAYLDWIRVKSPEDLREKVRTMEENDDAYLRAIEIGWRLFKRDVKDRDPVRLIEKRLEMLA